MPTMGDGRARSLSFQNVKKEGGMFGATPKDFVGSPVRSAVLVYEAYRPGTWKRGPHPGRPNGVVRLPERGACRIL